MTKRDAERIVRAWRRRLALDHWSIEVEMDVDFGSGTQDAEVGWAWSYDTATLRLAADWREYEPDRAQAIIVHELLHLLSRDLNVAVADITASLSKRERSHVRDRWQHELEGVVDRLAVRLVEIGGLV